jgi:formylglycine-generating enzyme
MFGKTLTRTLLAVVIVATAVAAHAAITIETVPVGNPGNLPDTRYNSISVGAVAKPYAIGTYEVTAGQYCDFLNAVAASDPYGLYNPSMDSDSYGCQITRHGTSGSYTYDFSGGTLESPGSTAADWRNRPVNLVSWGDAARFCNWLQNGQPTGAQGPGTTETGAYTLGGGTSNAALMAITRESAATSFIPTEDEWYKAAYHNMAAGTAASYFDYPTGTNSVPSNVGADGYTDPGNHANYFRDNSPFWTIGSPYYRTKVGEFEHSASPYGTFDQGGNVLEWNETNISGYRGLRGGSFVYFSVSLAASNRLKFQPTDEDVSIGFRVASVPEPGSIALLLAGASLALLWRWRRREDDPLS